MHILSLAQIATWLVSQGIELAWASSRPKHSISVRDGNMDAKCETSTNRILIQRQPWDHGMAIFVVQKAKHMIKTNSGKITVHPEDEFDSAAATLSTSSDLIALPPTTGVGLAALVVALGVVFALLVRFAVVVGVMLALEATLVFSLIVFSSAAVVFTVVVVVVVIIVLADTTNLSF